MSFDSFIDDLYAEFRSKSPHENILFSPFSISLALSMIYCGSEGNTEDQITKAFGLYIGNYKSTEVLEEFQKLSSKKPSVKARIFNNLFLESRYKVKSGYLKLLKGFGCKALNLPFKTKSDRKRSADAINKLVAESTGNRIKRAIAPESLTELTRMVLTSVVHFKGLWSLGFNMKTTFLSTF